MLVPCSSFDLPGLVEQTQRDLDPTQPPRSAHPRSQLSSQLLHTGHHR